MLKLILFALVYTLVFTSYYFLTSFLNIIYPNEAFISFAIFYGVYAISSLFAPLIIDKIPFKIALFLSTFSFLIFIGFSSSYISALMLIGSVVAGAGNSIIWCLQGQFTSAYDGKSIGIFYSIFNANMLFGNILALIVLLVGGGVQIILFILIGITAGGCVLSLFINQENKNKENNNNNINNEEKKNLKSILEVFKVISKCYILIPMFIAQSIGLNITFQIIPKLVLSTNINVSIFNTVIFLVYGVTSIIFSWIWGKLFDKSWKLLVIPYCLLEISCCITIFLFSKFIDFPAYYILPGFLRGLIDSNINVLLNVTLSKYESKDINNLFGIYRFIYSSSYLITSILIGYIRFEIILLINTIFCISATIFYFFLKLPKLPEISIEDQFSRNTFEIRNVNRKE